MPVEVRYQGRAETVALVEGKLHLGTVANIFGLDPMSIKIKGATEPANPSDGLTFNKFQNGGVLDVTGKPREGCSKPQVLQQGSLLEGEVFITVLMRYGSKELTAELLLDTGCDMDINLSDYKANQLGLPPPTGTVHVEMGQSQVGTVWLRGSVKTTLLLEGENPEEVLEDPLRSRMLEVWTDKGTSAGSMPVAFSSATTSGAGTVSLTIQVLSPIRKGKDRHEYDAILGAPGMARMRLGVDKDTGRLCVKKRTCLHKK